MSAIKNRIGLSGFSLKIIAIISMLCSHIPIVLPNVIPQKFLLPMFYLGRLAFPIFAFFIAVGWSRTRSRAHYALRIFIMALFSQIPFSVGLKGQQFNGFESVLGYTILNIGFSFLLAMVSLLVYDLLRRLKLPSLISIAVAMLPALAFEFLTPYHVDYGYMGVLLILVMYATMNNKDVFPLAMYAVLVLMSGTLSRAALTIRYDILLAYLAAGGLILLYNGKRGPRAKSLFYIFYPLHIIILLLIKVYLF